jgi:type II secretory pathway component PulC
LLFFGASVGTVEKADWQVLLEKLNKDTKTVVVADGSGNQDKETIANESRDVDHVLFSKTGRREKVKPGKAMREPGCRRVWPPKSPHPPQARRQPMFISRTRCAKLIPKQEARGFQRPS